MKMYPNVHVLKYSVCALKMTNCVVQRIQIIISELIRSNDLISLWLLFERKCVTFEQYDYSAKLNTLLVR